MGGSDPPQIPTQRHTTSIIAQQSVLHKRRKLAATDIATEICATHATSRSPNRGQSPPKRLQEPHAQEQPKMTRLGLQTSQSTPICTGPPKLTTSNERNWPLDIDPVHKHSMSDGKAAGDLATRMTALQIDQVFINSSAIDTCSSMERGASGVVMVGMGVLKGAGCNGNAGNVRRARPRVSWSAPDRLDQGTDVSGLSSTGYLHKIPITFCYSSDWFRSFLCKRKRTKPKHPSLHTVSPRRSL